MMVALDSLAWMLMVAAAVVTVAYFGHLQVQSRRRLAGRLEQVAARAAPGRRQAPGQSEVGPFMRLGAALAGSSLVGGQEVDRLRRTLYAAGFPARDAVTYYIGLKLVLAALLLSMALLFTPPGTDLTLQIMALLGALVGGLRVPDMILSSRADGRRQAMDMGLPDALDLLVVCGEAGIGLDQGLERVARELGDMHPDLARELAITVSEMRLLPDRLQALANMGERMQLESVRNIASTLSQTLRYGTPLGRALRTLAADLRLVRLSRMEERAARLPVLITVPMILLILPATTLVVAGPAFIQLIKALSEMG